MHEDNELIEQADREIVECEYNCAALGMLHNRSEECSVVALKAPVVVVIGQTAEWIWAQPVLKLRLAR